MNIELVKVKESDLELLMNWRTNPKITKYMFTNPKLDINTQKEWYDKNKNDENRLDYIICVDGKKIGLYSISAINYEKSTCECGFYIGETDYWGKGIFQKTQVKVNDLIFNKLNINCIILEVLENNPAIKSYEKLGFIRIPNLDKRIIKESVPYIVFHYELKNKYVKDKNDKA